MVRRKGTLHFLWRSQTSIFKNLMIIMDMTARSGVAEGVKYFKKNMKKQGCAARWGGEEFLLVFSEKGLDTSLEEAQKIREKIRKLRTFMGIKN